MSARPAASARSLSALDGAGRRAAEVNMRLARPAHVIDIDGLTELSFIRATYEGGVALGALTRHRAAERSSEIAARASLLALALPLIGDRQVRCRGTSYYNIVEAVRP